MLPGKDNGTVHATGIDDGDGGGSEGGGEEEQYEPWSRQRSVASLRPVKVIRDTVCLDILDLFSSICVPSYCLPFTQH